MERQKKRSSSRYWLESSESTNWWGIKEESEIVESEDEAGAVEAGEDEEPALKKRKVAS